MIIVATMRHGYTLMRSPARCLASKVAFGDILTPPMLTGSIGPNWGAGKRLRAPWSGEAPPSVGLRSISLTLCSLVQANFDQSASEAAPDSSGSDAAGAPVTF